MNQANGVNIVGTQTSQYKNLKTSQFTFPERHKYSTPKKHDTSLFQKRTNPAGLGYDVDFSMAEIHQQITNLIATEELTKDIAQQYENMNYSPKLNVQKHIQINGIYRGKGGADKKVSLTTGTMTENTTETMTETMTDATTETMTDVEGIKGNQIAETPQNRGKNKGKKNSNTSVGDSNTLAESDSEYHSSNSTPNTPPTKVRFGSVAHLGSIADIPTPNNEFNRRPQNIGDNLMNGPFLNVTVAREFYHKYTVRDLAQTYYDSQGNNRVFNKEQLIRMDKTKLIKHIIQAEPKHLMTIKKYRD